MAWREELHPRDARGRFTHKGSLPAVRIDKTLSNPQMASMDDLLDVFHRLSSTKRLNTRNLAIIDAELARREGVAELPPPDDTPEQTRVDDLVRRGWSYADAYAEAYDLSSERMAQQEASALVERRSGETAEQARRRAYREMVAVSVLQAEEATRGNLLSKKCPGADPATLWSAAPDRARRCASEELLRWWESQGGRPTYSQWRSRSGGASGRQKRHAQAQALAGSGRDFGL